MDQNVETTLRWIEAEDLATEFLPSPYPPRSDRGALGPLVRSIRRNGCICPIIARPLGSKLQVVCGYRRLLAAQAAKIQAVPVLVREMNDEESRRLFAEENFLRGSSESLGGDGSESRRPRRRELGSVSRFHENREAQGTEGLGSAGPLAEDRIPSLRRTLEKRLESLHSSGDRLEPPSNPFEGAEPEGAAQEVGSAFGGTESQLLPAAAIGIPGFDSPIAGHTEIPIPKGAPPDVGMIVLMRRTEECFRTIQISRTIPVETVEAIASDLIALSPLSRGRDLRMFYAEKSTGWLASHSLLVTGLGIHMAKALEWTPGQVKKFALACLLHDVGMLFIPGKILDEPRPLTRPERDLVERHPEIGREIIQSSHAWGAQIHLVAQDHHERWNGMGYPRRKKGNEVDLPSRIVGFLDSFGALISKRPHRSPLLYSQALKAMSTLTEMGFHDPAILVHFRNIFTELPVGSCLRLKDGRIGRIVGRDPRNPLRSRLRILEGSQRDEGIASVWIGQEEPSEGVPAPRADVDNLQNRPAPGGSG